MKWFNPSCETRNFTFALQKLHCVYNAKKVGVFQPTVSPEFFADAFCWSRFSNAASSLSTSTVSRRITRTNRLRISSKTSTPNPTFISSTKASFSIKTSPERFPRSELCGKSAVAKSAWRLQGFNSPPKRLRSRWERIHYSVLFAVVKVLLPAFLQFL